MSERGEVEVTSSVNQSSVTNHTEVDGLTNCDQVGTAAKLFFIIVYSLVFLVGLLLNGFIMKFYFCRGHRQASSSIVVYLKNLAAADFLLCLCLLLRIINYASSTVAVRLVYCNFGSILFFLNIYASIMFMCYIAANRYLKVVRGTSGTHILQTVQAAHIVCTVTWVLLLAMSSTFIILSFHTQKPLTSDPVNCEVIHSDQLIYFHKVMHGCACAVFVFFLVSLVFFYYSTSRRVMLAQRSQPASSSSKKLVKSHRKILVLVCVFCFCFVPYHLVRLSKAFLWRYCSWRKVLYYLMEVSIIMSVLNICLDPLLYFIFCKAFRTRLSQRLGSRK
ncbi:P2Y purinoceptor 14-like [Dicentrarchus labrax]|nr:P2Y purinoceptor 14-like [Dicentrarchus labrax]XP_051242615.1 P2Y purinoceptor 14-like [Dicentrarchus labrax]XP_051242616.1 P2Y purinoceptor 14-like [Dicentrarchus labrax]XP_051242617.1 P2Y purinoceptor 14-like [Dicentrarchus labrax]